MRTPSLALVTSLVLLAAGCREDVEPTRVSHSPQASRAAATVVTIYPGDDIQAKVNRTPPGSEFRFAAGVHRMERPIRPRTGDTFTKVPGTKPILNGSRLLTGFSKQGRDWVKTGQTQQGPTHFEGERPITCVSNYPRCAHPEDLFINDRLLRHVASLSAVGPGTWYFDYAADKIYIDERDLGTDPSRHKVETGVGPHAFLDTAGVDNVTIRSLTIAKFATPPRRGAIQPDTTSTTSTGWLVEHNEVRWNHAGGISTSTRMVAPGNHTHHNGQ